MDSRQHPDSQRFLDLETIATKIFQFEVYSEICGNDCLEIVHNHFNCPVCNTNYSPSDQYCDLLQEEPENIIIQCQSCQSKFKLFSKQFSYFEPNLFWLIS